MDTNDDIKVTDFGIARLVDGSTGTLTDSNAVLGSVHYVSPEQANGDPVDAKSDLYSMGIVLYEMLTGTVPFDGETAVTIALKQVNELPRSMRAIYRDIPKSLDEVVMKALEKAPELRYKSAADMAKDLKRALKLPKGGFVNSSGFFGNIVGYVFKNGLNAVLITLSSITVLVIVIYGFVKVSDILYGVDVPSVVGMSLQQAQDAVKDSDLIVRTREVYSDSAEVGVVIDQEPNANSRGRRNDSVTLTVSLGLEPVALPNTTGMNIDEALQTLAVTGFTKYDIKYRYESEREMDTVLEQEPVGPSAAPGSEITLYVNSPKIKMPMLSGKTRQQAQEALDALLLKYEVISGYPVDGAADTVILQYPAPGAELDRGETVKIMVSLKSPMRYLANFARRVPAGTNVRIVIVSPSGKETQVFDEYCREERVIYLELESDEPGEHGIKVYYNDGEPYTDKLTFV